MAMRRSDPSAQADELPLPRENNHIHWSDSNDEDELSDCSSDLEEPV
jgi:hypothetical protein